MWRASFLLAVCFSGLCAGGQATVPITEKIEWTWTDRPNAPVAALPNVLLVGDSIARNYYPFVEQELKGVANVYLFATSASGGDPRLPTQLHDYFGMMGLPFAVVHFNNGLHGVGSTDQQYAAGLPAMIAALRAGAPKATLVWATTTPVRDNPTSGGLTSLRVDERNRLAAVLMSGEAIAVDDQHALMALHAAMHSDDVHFTDEGSAIQATQVAATVRKALPKP